MRIIIQQSYEELCLSNYILQFLTGKPVFQTSRITNSPLQTRSCNIDVFLGVRTDCVFDEA